MPPQQQSRAAALPRAHAQSVTILPCVKRERGLMLMAHCHSALEHVCDVVWQGCRIDTRCTACHKAWRTVCRMRRICIVSRGVDTCKLAFHTLNSSSLVQTNASSPFLRTTRCTSCCCALANFTAVRVTCSMPSSTIQIWPPDTQVSMINTDTPLPRPSPLPAHVTPSFASSPPASSAKARALFSALSSTFGCQNITEMRC
jgi:hypothetical protein